MVIASISGWDGVRILGAFDSKEIAIETCEEAGFDTNSESFHIDIVKVNQISDNYRLIIDESNKKSFVKIHVYDYDNEVANDES